MPTETTIEPKLKEAVQLTEADWAVLAERVGGVWLLRSSHKLSKSAQNELMGILAMPSIDAWLSGAVTGGYTRSTGIPDSKKLGDGRFYAFPIANSSKALLIGAEEQTNTALRIWRLTASLLADATPSPNAPLLPDLQTGLAFNLPLALEKVLGAFTSAVPSQGAWLAIRRGDWLDIQAEFNAPNVKNESMPIGENPILRRVNRSLSDVVLSPEQPNWDLLPHAPIKPNTRAWISLPLMIGQRLIGLVSLWRQKEFTLSERGQLRELAAQVSPSVETVVTFSEMTAHLRRLGLLNDFVLTVSSAQNLDQIARRMFALLARAFNTELIALYLRSSDGRILRDYRTFEGKLNVISVPASNHPMQEVLKDGRVRRIADSTRDGFIGIHPESKSELIAPLRYRGQATGVLVIESPSVEAFSQYDERLMVVIASHLAGLIEYTRLREEAEGRARSLGLIHEVVGQVIGLNDKKEVATISAELVAQYFKYEMAVVLLADDKQKFSIQGIGGTHADRIQQALHHEEFIKPDGVTGYVAQIGESILINDTTQHTLYKPIQGWEAHSEICVAIKDGDHVLGIIDVESRQQNAFSHNDLIAMEALAGILSSVITSANQYQKLQETVKQLRLTETELKARMEAQRAAEAKLLQAEKMATAGRLSASIAHELNNPLQSVQNCLHLAGREDLPQEKRDEYFNLARTELERLMVTSRRMLDFYRPNTSSLETVNLVDLLQYTLTLLSKQLTESNVQVNVDIPDEIPSVSAVGSQIQQVFINLILNAADVMTQGGEIKISMHNQVSGVEMIFHDNGPGIPLEKQKDIFEPFFSTKDGGTGLGLTISYNIITAHGGVLELLTERSPGACFRIYLPAGGTQQ
ncbi:MAG: GAF domain-containing protein [Anaerolineales bacterium]|nr:GAF domain-containing protein [Anaerolineales bacterium]